MGSSGGLVALPDNIVIASNGGAAAAYNLGSDEYGNMDIGSSLPDITPGSAENQAGYNTAVGRDALQALTEGSFNVAVGDEALKSFTTAPYGGEYAGGENTAIGQGAAAALQTGQRMVAVGRDALAADTIDQGNVAVGWSAMASLNSADGNAAENTAIGNEAMNNANSDGPNTCQFNTAVGSQAMANGQPMSGNANTAVGALALWSKTSGNQGTAVGAYSLQNVTTGSENSALGENAGAEVVTGSYNVAIGTHGVGPTGDYSFTVCIGRGVTAGGWGGVAIGTDSGGVAATAAQDVFAVGTATHRVKVSNNATGAGTPELGANCPATVPTAPYTWFRMMAGDGTVVYVPAWK